MLAVAQQKLGTNDIFGEGGKVAEGAKYVFISYNEYLNQIKA